MRLELKVENLASFCSFCISQQNNLNIHFDIDDTNSSLLFGINFYIKFTSEQIINNPYKYLLISNAYNTNRGNILINFFIPCEVGIKRKSALSFVQIVHKFIYTFFRYFQIKNTNFDRQLLQIKKDYL